VRPERRAGLRRVLAAALVAAAGCAPSVPPAPSSEPTPTRLGVLSPSAAETLVALGAGDHVVAVGEWVDWPPELASRPRVGTYTAPNAERIVELGVDLVVTVDSVAGRRELAELAKLGVGSLALDTSTFEGARASIERLGGLVGRETEAAAILDDLDRRLDEIERRAAGAPRRAVLVAVGRDPLFVAGPGSHLDRLVRLAGGRNVMDDLGSPYAEVSFEAVLARAPEVIVDLSENGDRAIRGRTPGDWDRWPGLPAVREDRVHHVDPSRLSVPGIRLAEMAELVARLIHPERFGEPSSDAYGPLVGRRE